MPRTAKPYVNLAEAKAHLSSLVERASSGEEIVIARDHEPVARLVPLARVRSPRTPGSARGKVWIARDFDAIPPELDEYTR